jgi:DNA-binding NtrC family response regulator
MERPVLILSDDSDLVGSVTTYINSVYDTTVERGPDAAATLALLKQRHAAALLLDLQLPWINDVIERLYGQPGEEKANGARLVTLRGPSYPREVASTLDLHSFAHLDLPWESERAGSKLAFLNGGAKTNGYEKAPPPPTAVETGQLAISTYSPSLFPLIEQVCRVAMHNVTILFVGETGTGKSTLARIVHQLSPNRDQPFQNVACGALPRDLIESELFGHVRGAFTGADRSKIGRFEAAGRGTLLLDEIDVLGPKEQAKLLRVIETGEYEMVGSTETRVSKARLIVASNVDLETLAQEMQFRSDLYYRLNVLEFVLPPLRERQLDIVPMGMQFVDECCREHGIVVERVHLDFLSALKQYRWPGNIRELKNQIQRAVLFCERGDLTLSDLSPVVVNSPVNSEPADGAPLHSWTLADRVASSERKILEEVLKANGYKRTATARALGISRVGLYKKMRRYGMLETN